VQFDGNTTINGGALNTTSNGGVFVVNTGSATFSGVTNNSTVDVRIGTSLLISGTLTNNGTVFVNPNASPGVALIKFNNAELTGSGAVNLGSNGTTAQLSGTLTQDVSHTIEGFGDITATLTNNGLVTANAANQTLEVNGPTTNGSTGTMQANGGTLSFASGALTNLSGSTLTGGTYEVKATSTLTLPGTITTNNASVILRSTTSTFAAINSLATNDGEFAVFGGRSFTTAGNLTNAGMLTTGPTSSLTTSGTLNQTSTGMLEGAGTFTAKSFKLAGTVSPGVSTNYTPNEPGTLTLDGTTTFSSSLSLVLTLGSTSSSTNDHLVVNGKFTLDGILSINATAGFGTGLYDIIDYSGGTFVNDTLSIGSDMPAGFNYEILTNDPGQVDLMVTAIPEPATWAMALAGLGVLCLRKRFRGELRQ